MKIINHDRTAQDARGHIVNILELAPDANPVRGAAIITCLPGAVRSCHFHRTDGHWLHVLQGTMYYYERAIGSDDWGDFEVINGGSSIYTPPMVEHKTVFPVRTLLLSLSHNARSHEEHEADLVRVTP